MTKMEYACAYRTEIEDLKQQLQRETDEAKSKMQRYQTQVRDARPEFSGISCWSCAIDTLVHT